MLKEVGGAAVDLCQECSCLAKGLKLGAPGIEIYSFRRCVLMLLSNHVGLHYVVLLIGPAKRGTSPGGCRVAADSASQSWPSRCKTLRPLVRDFPLAELLLVFRVASLITPCFHEMQLLSFYAGSVSNHYGSLAGGIWESGGLHLGERRESQQLISFLCFSWSS